MFDKGGMGSGARGYPGRMKLQRYRAAKLLRWKGEWKADMVVIHFILHDSAFILSVVGACSSAG